jgi:ADP-ribosylation factor-like protein 4
MGGSLSRLDGAVHVAMVGLDAAGKSTVLFRLKFDEYVSTVPTVGFNCERVRGAVGNSRGVMFVMWDVGGQEHVRPLWRAYTRAADGVIFVVDSADVERLEEARIELHRMARMPEVAGVPVLVIANKHDLQTARSPAEIERALGLSELSMGGTRLCTVVSACAITGEGLDTGLDELYTMILRHRKTIKQKKKR